MKQADQWEAIALPPSSSLSIYNLIVLLDTLIGSNGSFAFDFVHRFERTANQLPWLHLPQRLDLACQSAASSSLLHSGGAAHFDLNFRPIVHNCQRR